MNLQSKLIVVVSIMASLLEIIDTSIVNVAIPTMMGNLGCTLDEISIIITSYAVANAIVLPLAAWLSYKFGLREYYLSCIAFFTLASVMCGFAPNLETLVICRILQGLAGGALLPTSQALIYQQFPKEKAGSAGAIFGMSVMIGPTLGPVLGGFLTDHFGWRAIFNVNLPIGLLTLCLAWLCIHNPKERQENSEKSYFDKYGLLFLVVGIGCLQFSLERGEANDWFESKMIASTFILSMISLVCFVWWELRLKYPIIQIKLFQERAVICGVLLMSLLGFYVYSVVFILPYFLQNNFHYTATQMGVIFIPGSLLTALIMPFIGKNLNKLKDARWFIFVGLFFIELSLFFMSIFSPRSSYFDVLIVLFLRGIALAFLFTPINTVVLRQYSGYQLSQVAGLLNLFRQIGGSIGIAIIDTMFARRMDFHYHRLAEKISYFRFIAKQEYFSIKSTFSMALSHNLGMGTPSATAEKIFLNRVQSQALMLSFIDMSLIIGGIFISAFFVLYFLKIKHPR